MDEQEKINRRSILCSLCADYVDANLQYLLGKVGDEVLENLEELMLKQVTPLSFMNTLEKEVANADSN